MKTIDQLITETAENLNLKLTDKKKSNEDAEKFKNELDKFKQLKKDMDADPDFALHFEFK